MVRKRGGRPPSPDPTTVVPARLNRSTVELLDAVLAARRMADPDLTRQDLLREAVGRFLAAERRKGMLR
jgi:hypothetical protein